MKYNSNFNPLVSNKTVFKALREEKDNGDVGYYILPSQDISYIKEFAKTITKKNIAIIGIGGSSLGIIAIYDFLKRSHSYEKNILFFESTDPLDINSKLKQIDINNTIFIPISKSGDTIETISIFTYIHSKVKINKNNCVVITEQNTKLDKYANNKDIKSFYIPKNVGGRFSVFSVVGLVPLAILGINIDALLDGCKYVHNSYFQKKEYYKSIMSKARFMAENRYSFNINVLFSYFTGLEGFNKWYVQLWGESLGKIDKRKKYQGLTPVGLLGPMDQHSFLQLITQGIRDKTITFITLEDWGDDTAILNEEMENIIQINNNLKFSELINHQANATIKAVRDLKDIPCDIINIQKADEYNLAKLMFSYQLLVSSIASFLDINAYDQPGVEEGKKILKDMILENKGTSK